MSLLELHRRFIDGSWRYVSAQEALVQRFSAVVTPATTSVVIENVPVGTIPLRLDISVLEAFDGNSPRVHVATSGAIAGVIVDQLVGHVDLGQADGVDFAPLNGLAGGGNKFEDGDYFNEDTVVSAILDDGSGGNPGSTVGLARVSLIVILP